MPSVTTAISLPEAVIERADRLATRDGISRDDLIRLAIERYLSRSDADDMTRRINAHLDEHPLTVDELHWVEAGGADVARAMARDDER